MSQRYLHQLERDIKQQINQLEVDEIRKEYNIIIGDDKSIYDELNNRYYKDIDDWLYDYLDDSKEDIDYLGSHRCHFDD
jgi:hypothetical protein